jgi:hypothetical protein
MKDEKPAKDRLHGRLFHDIRHNAFLETKMRAGSRNPNRIQGKYFDIIRPRVPRVSFRIIRDEQQVFK